MAWIVIIMRHQSPRVNSKGPTVHADEIAGHVLRSAVQRGVKNPMVEAIFEEMGPEIDGLLKRHLGSVEVDLTQMQNGLDRVGRVAQKIAQKTRRPTA